MAKKGNTMKVYFCRDRDGGCTTWRYKQTKPVLYKDKIWDRPSGCSTRMRKIIVTEGNENTFRKFGKGFHGVRKGKCALLDLNPKIRGTFHSF